MNPVERSDASGLLMDTLGDEGDLSYLSMRVVESVGALIPMEAVVFVPGNPMRVFAPDGFPAERCHQLQSRLENNSQMLQELAEREGKPPEPLWFNDGSLAFLLPLVHNGVLEAVLGLHRATVDCHDTLLRQVKSLAPVCRFAAGAIVRTLDREGREVRKVKENPKPEADPRSVVVSRVLHNIAHDIRTPATAVRGYVRMLVDGRVGTLTPDQKECLEIVLRSASQLAALGMVVDEAASVLEGLNAEILDLRDLWSSACNASRPQVLAGGMLIKERIPPEKVLVTGDRAVLTAVLAEVLTHALGGLDVGVPHGTEVRADLTGGGRNEATLRIELPRSAHNKEDAERIESFLKLRNKLFLHGGSLSQGNKGEQAVFTISLPGQSI